MLRKATALDWAGDPLDEVQERFIPLHGERNFRGDAGHFKDYTDVVGDHPQNMVATALGVNGYALTGEDQHKDGCSSTSRPGGSERWTTTGSSRPISGSIWRALEGPGKEIYFSQIHEPGELGASDFTDLTPLGVTIQGQLFEHLISHFALTYSNWETATICFAESFESLSHGLQNALWDTIYAQLTGGREILAHARQELGDARVIEPDAEWRDGIDPEQYKQNLTDSFLSQLADKGHDLDRETTELDQRVARPPSSIPDGPARPQNDHQ